MLETRLHLTIKLLTGDTCGHTEDNDEYITPVVGLLIGGYDPLANPTISLKAFELITNCGCKIVAPTVHVAPDGITQFCDVR